MLCDVTNFLERYSDSDLASGRALAGEDLDALEAEFAAMELPASIQETNSRILKIARIYQAHTVR